MAKRKKRDTVPNQKPHPLIQQLREAEAEWRGRPVTSVNDLLAQVQDAFPHQGLGHTYARVITAVVLGKPWQLDAKTPEAPLVMFLQQRAKQHDTSAQIILKKMGISDPNNQKKVG